MTRTHYSPTEIKQLRKLKSMPGGKVKTEAVKQFAQQYDRGLSGVVAKMSQLRPMYARTTPAPRSFSSPVPVLPDNGTTNTVRIPFTSIQLDLVAKEMIISW